MPKDKTLPAAEFQVKILEILKDQGQILDSHQEAMESLVGGAQGFAKNLKELIAVLDALTKRVSIIEDKLFDMEQHVSPDKETTDGA